MAGNWRRRHKGSSPDQGEVPLMEIHKTEVGHGYIEDRTPQSLRPSMAWRKTSRAQKRSPRDELMEAFANAGLQECSPVAGKQIEGSLSALPAPQNPDRPTPQEITAFTSAKLDLMNLILRDHRRQMNPSAKNTAIYLLQCVNSATLQCNPSYQTIADALGFKNEKTAERAIKAVKACGWIDIRRFNRAKSNRYVFLANAAVAKAIDEYQDHLREQRKAEREENERLALDQTKMSGRMRRDQTFQSPLDQTKMSGKHLNGTPEVFSSNEERDPLKIGSVPTNGYAAAKADDQGIPFPPPASEEELADMMSRLFTGFALGPLTMKRMRTLLAAGRLTPAIVEGQRRTDAA
jgi:hypothetical protein